MASPRMRPTFAQTLSSQPEGFYGALNAALRSDNPACTGSSFGTAKDGGAILRRPPKEQHFWSPALHLHIVTDDDGTHTLHGKFSPSSPVWTAFIAIYLSLACIAIGCGSYGGAQMILDEEPWAFIGVPIAIALAAFTYGAAFIGQGLGSDDMYELRHFIDEVIASADKADA